MRDRPPFDTAILIAKEPVPGRVKTRLTPALTACEAAGVAAAALCDTFDAVERVPATRRVLAFDGNPLRWLRSGWACIPQPDGGLDERLAAAFETFTSGPAVLVGMDTPQLRAEQLLAWDPTTHDACLGPAVDGGYWAIGLADPRLAGAALRGIPMSDPSTGARQLERLRGLGLRVALLDTLTDVDTIDTARSVAAAAPHTRFAAALGRVQRLGA